MNNQPKKYIVYLNENVDAILKKHARLNQVSKKQMARTIITQYDYLEKLRHDH